MIILFSVNVVLNQLKEKESMLSIQHKNRLQVVIFLSKIAKKSIKTNEQCNQQT